jgi:hypothetical protein
LKPFYGWSGYHRGGIDSIIVEEVIDSVEFLIVELKTIIVGVETHRSRGKVKPTEQYRYDLS